MYTDPSGNFLTFSIGPSGFSIGLNFGIGGFGINAGWNNGGSIGAYAELGPRIGNLGATASVGVDYHFGSEDVTGSAGIDVGLTNGKGYIWLKRKHRI